MNYLPTLKQQCVGIMDNPSGKMAEFDRDPKGLNKHLAVSIWSVFICKRPFIQCYNYPIYQLELLDYCYIFQVSWEDIIGEPQGSHSPECVWNCSRECFKCTQSCCYTIMSSLSAPCIAFGLACNFACLAFNVSMRYLMLSKTTKTNTAIIVSILYKTLILFIYVANMGYGSCSEHVEDHLRGYSVFLPGYIGKLLCPLY